MKLSIITPTHNPKYMKELCESILNQTHEDWEWIIVLNNGAQFLPPDDDRIKLIECPFSSSSVGQLKKYACSLATGEIIVEVDHDDIITKDCLEELEKVFLEDGSIGFAYSDNAKLSDNFVPYNPAYGWEHYKFDFNNKLLTVMKSFQPTPYRLGYIWFSPDHVRAWRKTVYDEVGGHDPKLEICDDHDLICRMYLKTKFKHIPKCLYIYRITGENTWIERNQKIQELTKQLFDKYIYQLATRFAEINNLKKIDLCGGFNKPDGYESIDLNNGDIKADLEKGIPLPDNSVGVIRAHDALEHIKDKQLIMKEIHRVLVPGGILLSMTPSTDGRGAFQDPTHVSFWNENSFWYWTRPEQMKYINNTDIKFREARLFTYFPSDYHKNNNISYVKADLEVIK